MDWTYAKGTGVNSKPQNKPKQTLDLTSLLSLILRGGVILSAAIIAFGLLLFLITGQSGYILDTQAEKASAQQYFAYHAANPGEVYFPVNPVEIWQGVLNFKAFAIIMFGLGLLILTPVMNVALAAFGFLRQRNLAFTLISLFVLAVLVLSFLLGKIEG